MTERFHTIQVRAEDAAEVALAIARRFRTLGWKVVRDPKGRGAPASGGDPEGLRRFLISPSDRGWVTILPSGTPDSGPDSLVAFLARDLETLALWTERAVDGAADHLAYEVYWKNKRIDRQEKPLEPGAPPPPYPTLVDQDLQSLGGFLPVGQKHPKITVADLPRFYPKYAGDKAYLGRFKKLVMSADYPMTWGSYENAWTESSPEAARLESWGHLGFQKEDGRSAAARLTHGDPAARRSAVEALASCSIEEARPGLQAALADDDAEVRLASALVLAARPDKGLAQDLADRMADEDVRVRIAAAKALRDMGVPGTFEALQEVVLEDELEVRRAAAAALSNIATPAARAVLVTASKRDKDAEVRRWAALGLGRAPLPEVAGELARLLADKDPGVRAAAAQSVAAAHAVEAAAADAKAVARAPSGGAVKPVAKLVAALRNGAKRDKDDAARAAKVRALAVLLPLDDEARDLAMQLLASQVKAGELHELAVRLPPRTPFEAQDKRIATALLRRLEKTATAEVILALSNQTDERVPEALHGLIPRLWGRPDGEVTRADVLALGEARSALIYGLARLEGASALPALLRILDLEHTRKAPADPALANEDEHVRVTICFEAIEAVLDRLASARPADLEKVTERLRAWLGSGAKADASDPGAAVLRRVALVAYGRAEKPAPAPSPSPLPIPVAIPVKGPKAVAKTPPASAELPPSPVKPPKLPAIPGMSARPAIFDKSVVAVARPLVQDPRWPEAAMVLARQTGARAVPVLVAALTRSIDREVRLAKKGGYSKRDAELVANHRRGIVLALKEIKDPACVPALVRLVTLESLRAGKLERRTETSLLGVTIATLQAITGYKFGAEPQRWQEVVAGKLPLIAEAPKKAPAPAPAGDEKKKEAKAARGAPAAKAKPAKKAAPPKKAAKTAKAKKSNVLKLRKAPVRKTGAKKASPRKAAKAVAKKPGALRRLAGILSKGAKRLTQPKRMAAKAARRR